MRERTTLMLLDGTVLKAGDRCCARASRGEASRSGWRVVEVVSFAQGTGVEKALVTAPIPFGTQWVGRYDLKKYSKPNERMSAKPKNWKRILGQKISRLSAAATRTILDAHRKRGLGIGDPAFRELTGGYSSQAIDAVVIRKLAERAGIRKPPLTNEHDQFQLDTEADPTGRSDEPRRERLQRG